MASHFCFQLADQPGALADIAEKLSHNGINIDGFAGMSANGKGIIKVYTKNVESAEETLKENEIDFEKQEVLVLKMEDQPGQIANLSRALSDEGINIDALYISMSGNQVIHTNNLARTKEIATELGML